MIENDENPFIKPLQIDEETMETLQRVAAIDQDEIEVALEAMGGNEEIFREFGKQTGITDLLEFQQLSRLIRIRDQHKALPDAFQPSISSGMKSFLSGLGIGIGLGILFAPMSGEETRNNLTQRASDLADAARDLIGEGRERVRSTMSAIRGQAERSSQKEGTGAD